jgi:proteic killer suppression protein
VIISFADLETEAFFREGRRPKAAWQNITNVAARKLDMVNAATRLNDLKFPPRNFLEALKGNRAGQHSIRINDQWRICFIWTDAGPTHVEIVDYH